MKTVSLITALCLCSIGWISISESQTIEVQPGEDVTLQCTSTSKYNSVTFWLRLVNRTKINCITVMTGSVSQVYVCDGFKSERHQMSSNISTIFLKIKQVDISDSGLYFCGTYASGRPSLSIIRLHVEGSDGSLDDMGGTFQKKSDATNLTIAILGGVIAFLVMVIIGLLVKIRKLLTAEEESDPQQNENLDSDELNYATVTFQPKAKRRVVEQPKAKRRVVEPNVVYAATR